MTRPTGSGDRGPADYHRSVILIDEPRWPAHGTHFAHLVSDASHEELFDFAQVAGLHPRAFDHDHYDVAERRFDDLVVQGAVPAASTELVRRLKASGLRVPQRDRTPKVRWVLQRLRDAWAALLPGHPEIGDDLIARWTAPDRHYHDARHLWQVLTALDDLFERASSTPSRAVRLAAWFHDAVHDGRAGDDERASADLASELLTGHIPEDELTEIRRLVLLTASHDPEPGDHAGEALNDADLSILGQARGRYWVYSRDVRLDYAHVPDNDFSAGRSLVLDDLRSRHDLFRTAHGRDRWASKALENLSAERDALAAGPVWPLNPHA